MIPKIAIFNDFQLPLPAVQGGAVQQLTTALLDQNELDHRYDFEVFSPYAKTAVVASKKYKYTKFYYSKFSKIIRFYTNLCFKLHLPVDLSAMPIAPDVAKVFRSHKYDAVYVSGYIRGVLSICKLNGNRSPVYYHHHVITDIFNEPTVRGKDIFEVCEKIAFVSQYGCDRAKIGGGVLPAV